LNAIARVAAPVRMGDFNAQNLSIMIWAFATLNHHEEEEAAPLLFHAIARAASVRINEFNPQKSFQYCMVLRNDEP
jgi:hypothetical protein